MRADFCYLRTGSTWIEDMGRQESPQLIERKTQVDTDAQETSRASKLQEYWYLHSLHTRAAFVTLNLHLVLHFIVKLKCWMELLLHFIIRSSYVTPGFYSGYSPFYTWNDRLALLIPVFKFYSKLKPGKPFDAWQIFKASLLTDKCIKVWECNNDD